MLGKLVIALFSAVLTASASVPQQINYQGYLTRPDGTSLDTTVAMTFRFYTASFAGTWLWTEIHPSVPVSHGVFATQLGQITAIPDSVLDRDQLWLSITVGNHSPMTPRIRVFSVPYSNRTGTVDGASGGDIAGGVKVTGSGSFGNNPVSNSVSGTGAFASGSQNMAVGRFSFACGQYSLAEDSCTFAAGSGNMATDDFAIAVGGRSNYAQGAYATITGGYDNATGGYGSTVAGGFANTASGDYSFAAGYHALADELGSFVWSDASSATNFSVSNPNQFYVRATGGIRLYTASDLTAGARLAAGGSSWIAISDSTVKRNRRNVNTEGILRKVTELPIQQWSYKAQDPSIEHIGPMAQDFWRAFHVGEDSLGIATIDADGVMLAAIQELARRIQQIDELKLQVAQLRAEVQSLMAGKQ